MTSINAVNRKATVGLIGASMLVAPGGCTGSTSWASAAPSATSTASASADAGPSTAPPALSGAIGTATFSGTGGTTGTMQLTARDGYLMLSSIDLVSPAAAESSSGAIGVIGAVNPIDPESTCFDTGLRLSFGDATPGTPYSAQWGLSEFAGDPTALDQLVLTGAPELGAECLAPVLAIADVVWSMTPLRVGLVAVDARPRAAAEGEVPVTDGIPTAYTVAPNDLVEDLAARFGITVDDLLYFNVFRSPSGETLRIGETLNLSVGDR